MPTIQKIAQEPLFNVSTKGKWHIEAWFEDPYTEERTLQVVCVNCKKWFTNDGKIKHRVKCPACRNRSIG